MVKIKGLVRFRCRLAPVATEVKTNLLPSQLVVEAEFLEELNWEQSRTCPVNGQRNPLPGVCDVTCVTREGREKEKIARACHVRCATNFMLCGLRRTRPYEFNASS